MDIGTEAVEPIMSDLEDRLPKRSYELIALLDEAVPEPSWPKTGHQCADLDDAAIRALCHAAGARSIVDELIAEVAAEIEGDEADDEGASDGSGPVYPTVFGPDGTVRDFLSSIRMAARHPEPSVDDGGDEG